MKEKSKAENKQTRTMILYTHFASTSQWVNNVEHKNFCAPLIEIFLGFKVNNSWKSFKVYLSSWTPLVTQTSRSPQTSWKLLSIYIIAKPKSGALVSLFSSPSLYWIKTVIKLFTGWRRVSPRGFKDQSRSWGGRKQLTRCGRRSTRMLVSGIFKQVI